MKLPGLNEPDISDLKRSVSTVDLAVSYGVALSMDRGGTYYTGLSPFRGEDTPSFVVWVDPERGWFDFGSGEGGDQIDFIAKIENCSSGEAMAKFRAFAKTKMGAGSQIAARSTIERRPPKVWTYEDWRPYVRNLWGFQGYEGRAFLKDRGLDRDKFAIANRYMLGFRRTSVPELGIPFFVSSAIVQVRWRYCGRAPIPDGRPKYLCEAGMSSPDTLFNENHLDVLRPTFLTEGAVDALTLIQAQIQAQALQSAHQVLSDRAANLLLQAKFVILAGDNEASGVGNSAMDRAKEKLGSRARRLEWPLGDSLKMDANSFYMNECGGDVKKFSLRVRELANA
jgi:DNA primase